MSDSGGPIPLRVLEEAARRLGQLVPAEATSHFLKAQRELLLGVAALVEHNSRPAKPAPGGRRTSGAGTRTKRPRRVSID